MIPDIAKNDIKSLSNIFKDETACIDYLEKLRWKKKVISPFDSLSKVYHCSESRYRCKNSGKYFNVKTNTIFHNTKIPLLKWFLAMSVANSIKGISSVELARQIDITQRSAWFMLQRIKNSNAWDAPSEKSTDKIIVPRQKRPKPQTPVSNDKLNMTEWLAYLKGKS